MPRRLLLEGPSLEKLKAQVLAEHGPQARIVAAERVVVGGIYGFFARQHFEVIVEIPDPNRRGARVRMDLPTRVGIAALLDGADAAEARMQGVDLSPQLSTRSEDFAELMDQLTFDVGPLADLPAVEPETPAVPEPLTGAGDLVLVVGLGSGAVLVARSMAVVCGGEVAFGGSCAGPGAEQIRDRRTALALRAKGVQGGHSVFIAFGLDAGGSVPGGVDSLGVSMLSTLGADQVWAVVDAGRKPEDTAHWVRAVAAVVPIDAIAVEGRETTASPETVDELGLPIGWVGRGAPR